jgi:3-oxoacyl-[acyl-carrier-protein] synthase-3
VTRISDGPTIRDLAVDAGRRALCNADVPVDFIMTASCSARAGSSQGEEIAQRLLPGIPTIELNIACGGFCYALASADAMIRTGQAHNVLIVAVEQMSSLIDPADLGTSIIFGDGAGAAVVGASPGQGIGPVVWGSDGAQSELIACEPTENGMLQMQGQSVFRWAVETLPGLALEACRRAGVGIHDIDVFVPHQANLRIIESVAQKLGIEDVVTATDITDTGNTSAASIPLALARLVEEGRTKAGQLALLAGFGAGLAYAAQVIELPAL